MTATPQNNEAQAAQPTEKEINFRKQEEMFKRQLEQERLARQQAEERAASLEKANKDRPNTRDLEDDDDSDEPYVDRKLLSKKLSKFEKQMEEKIEKKAEEKARGLMFEQNKSNFLKQNPDFNEIMSPEVLQKFVEKHPDVAEDLLSMPDTFERQRLVYRNIKALGVNKKEEPKQNIQDKIDQNRRSPYYQPSGVGAAPYQSAGDYSPSGQKSAYAKMQELKNKLRI
jgi:hypothetical protein